MPTPPRASDDPPLEAWLWEHLPYRLFMIVANIHDTLPFTKGEWTADADGFVR